MDWIDVAQNRKMAGICESGNKRSVSIKCREFLGLAESRLAS
jgi:hypothetical protein